MEYIFTNGLILTISNLQNPEAVYINGNIIEHIGNFETCVNLASDNVEIIDLKGKVLLPGFIDTHTHFFEYAKTFFAVDLNPAQSVDDIRKILIKYRASMPANIKWVGGSGWNKNIYPDLKGFNKTLLDEIFPDIPVSFESKDLHSKLCNSLALERAGITAKTPDPAGGKIGRFQNGEPDGFTYEKAWELIDRVVPQYTQELKEQAIKEAVQQCYKHGLVGVHVMEDEEKFNLYTQMHNDGLNFRFYWHFPSAILDKMIEKGIKSYSGNEYIKIGGMKIFMDGSLGSQSAWMYEPYTGTDNYGMVILQEDELYQLIKKGVQNGISSTIHGIGDRCNNMILNVIDRINKELKVKPPHRIEHLQCIRPKDYELIVKNNIYCAVQPIHVKADVKTIQAYWNHCEKNVYPFKDLLCRGITLGFGSDAPVETINPFEGIYSAVERRYLNLSTNPQWTPEQSLTVLEAIKGYTIDAAKGSDSQTYRGSIEVGKLADLIVIDNLPGIENEGDMSLWLKAQSYLTMISGKIVYREV